MAIRGEQDSSYTGVTELGTTFGLVRKGKGNVKLPQINGVEIGTTDPNGTVAYLRELDALQRSGNAPHRGRERQGSGPTLPDRPVRKVSRRGTRRTA